MTIRVVCTTCHSTSEVVNEAAGGQAICPFCSTVFSVPADGDPSPAKQTIASAIKARRGERRPLTNTPIDWGQIAPKTCLQISVDLFRANFRLLLLAHCLVLVASWVSELVVHSAPTALAGLLQLGAMAALVFLNIGLTLYTLQIARGGTPELGVLFSGGDRLARFAVFNVLFILLIAIGCLGFIVPGVYFASRFWAGGMMIIDQNCTVFEGFGQAGRFSEGNRLPSVMLGLISFGLALTGALLFGVGLILVYPLITVISVVAYLMLTRQPIERPASDAV